MKIALHQIAAPVFSRLSIISCKKEKMYSGVETKVLKSTKQLVYLKYTSVIRPCRHIFCTLIFALFLGSLVSCKKQIDPVSPIEPSANRSIEQLVADSVYYYYKEQSYWSSAITTYNPISTFTDQNIPKSVDFMSNARLALSLLKNQTPVYAGYNNTSIDRFSFVATSSLSSSSLRADKSDGYGIFETVARINNDTIGYIYISMVEGGSPASRAGIRRGDKIVGINENRNLNVPISDDNIILDQRAITLVEQALLSPAFNIEIERAGVSLKYDLQYGNYDIDPLAVDTIYTLQGKKIGYFALTSFEQTNGTSGAVFKSKLDGVFANFQREQVEDIIVDLRYNTGGYVHAAEYLANHLINNEGNQKLMYKSDTNPNLRMGRYAGEFDDVSFIKSTTLNPRKLYILIGHNTASASELVISALMAYYNPKGNNDMASRRMEIIGTLQAVKSGATIPSTYGKPMGFFPQKIMNRVDLWAASFKIINALNYTDYWDGIPATNPNPVQDNVLYNFGDPRESMIATALYHIVNNRYPTQANTQARGVRNKTTDNMTQTQIIRNLHERTPRELIKGR
ncbi:S41 family peptidase [Sphingobacterium corticibacter]|uniref:PDZ domain-containing protein n=1 Tax=Sphingobacterium corticibacter TaxID=2171749 RepID=A0A2T8HLC8_9SPHI|nr:S41 family peptidase [Sphingobacterium corticibacter]PVH26132.1 hypothetical protein DC487_00455 [Sphingobacterium corticibacter]